MSLLDMFPTPEAGAMLLATSLMGLRAADLKQCEPSLRPCVAFRGPPQLERVMKCLFKSILPRKRWKGKNFSIWRKRVVDLNEPLSLVDISRARVRIAKLKSTCFRFHRKTQSCWFCTVGIPPGASSVMTCLRPG